MVLRVNRYKYKTSKNKYQHEKKNNEERKKGMTVNRRVFYYYIAGSPSKQIQRE